MLTTSYTYYVPERYLDLFIPPHKKSCKTGIILIFTNKHKVTGSQNLNQGLNIKSTHLLYKHLSVSYMQGTVLGTRDINSSFKDSQPCNKARQIDKYITQNSSAMVCW